jgi:hypothetical protein
VGEVTEGMPPGVTCDGVPTFGELVETFGVPTFGVVTETFGVETVGTATRVMKKPEVLRLPSWSSVEQRSLLGDRRLQRKISGLYVDGVAVTNVMMTSFPVTATLPLCEALCIGLFTSDVAAPFPSIDTWPE